MKHIQSLTLPKVAADAASPTDKLAAFVRPFAILTDFDPSSLFGWVNKFNL